MRRYISSLIVLLSLTACDAQLADATCNDECDKLKILARRGDAPAQTELGLMYFRGTDVQKNDAEAVSLWQKAAAQDYAPAQNLLAQAYSCGVGGLKPDKAKAAELWEKANEREDSAPAPDNIESVGNPY